LPGDIGRLKDENNRAKWDPLRERQIYERLLKENGTTFPEDSLRTIFHEIITACRLSQRNIEVAYLGPEATFSHLAGVKYFGHSATYKPQESIDDVFSEVEKGRTRYGIVPVENSIEGSVVSTLDSFMKYKVQICGEVQLEISHNLVCRSGNIEDIQTVAPTPNLWPSVGSGCGNICRISRRCRCCPPGAAAQMAANNPNIWCHRLVPGDQALRTPVVVKGIEDYRGNTTRFLVIGKRSPSASGQDRTSLLVGTMDRPGALNEILTVLSEEEIKPDQTRVAADQGQAVEILVLP